jgi:predicted TIM-barrel fold metal-dependent hydrolase
MTSESPAFVDTHIHFWDRPHPTLRWDWLEPDFVHPQLGDIRLLKELKTFGPDELRVEAEGSNLVKTVHIQAAIGTEDPVNETKWLSEVATRTGWPNAIVASAVLSEPDVENTLERHAEYPLLRGVRDMGAAAAFAEPEFRRGYALLEEHGLVFEANVVAEDLSQGAALAEKHPNVTFIVDHTGFPQDRTAEYFHRWRKGIERFADIENAFMKVSGLGMGDQIYGRRWTENTLRPWIESSIEVFGPQRTFFGSNWPVDKMYSSYSDLMTAYLSILANYTDAERTAMLSANAERIYRI